MALEPIGLKAILEMDEFNKNVKVYESSGDAMVATNEQIASSTDDVTTSLSAVDDASATAGQSAVDLAAQMELVSTAIDAVKSAIGEAVELADLGSQANRAEDRFRAFAGEVGDADELLAAFNEGAGGTVDKLTAMTSAGRLLQMGLVSNNAEMEQVVEIATRLGDQTQSAGDRVSDFALLLANQSIPRLDNFGISSGRVRDRIKELQAAFPAMSREAAFSQAVFEQGAKSLDILGVRTQDAGTKMEVARANIQNMRIEMGQKLLPIVAELFGFIANLNTKTLAMIAVLGGGVPVVIKLGVAFKTLAQGMATSSTSAGAMALRMGVLAAAVVALVVVVDNFNNTIDRMSAAQDSAIAAGASLGDQFTALVEDGVSVNDAMAQMQEKINAATDAFESNAVTSSFLGEVFGANAAFADTLTESYDSLNESLAAGAPSYKAYVETAQEFNRANSEAPGRLEELNAELERLQATGLSTTEGLAGLASETRAVQTEIAALTQAAIEGTGSLTVLTEAQFNNNRLMQAGVNDASALNAAMRSRSATTEIATSAIISQSAAFDTHNRRLDSSAAATSVLTDARQQANAITERAARVEEMRSRSLDNSAASAGTAAAKAAELVAARQQANAITEKAARIEDMQATSALAAAAALEEKRQKDIEVVEAEQALAQSVLNASDAMIAQSFITGLDPDAMGLTAYRQAVEDIQLAFGLATPESIALARGINQGVDAINAGDIARDDMSGFINAIIDDSKDATSGFDNLSREFASSGAESKRLVARMNAVGESVSSAGDDVDDLNSAMMQAERSGQDAASGLEAVEAGSKDAIPAIDEATTAVGELDGAMSSAAAAAGAHGAAVGGNFGDAMNAAVRPLIDDFKGQLQDLRDALPGSEPADTTSPLFGLSDAGEAIVDNIAEGITSAAPNAALAMSQVGEGIKNALTSAVGGLGGTAAGIFTRETVDPLKERTKTLTADIDEGRKALEKLDKEISKVSEMQAASDLTPEKQTELASKLLALETERARLNERITRSVEKRSVASKELTAQEARLERFRGAQERLKFLEQQSGLLELIAENALDADAILGGITLGVDADAGAIMDAMANATELLVARAEQRLMFGKQLTDEEKQALALQQEQAELQGALKGAQERLAFLKQQAALLKLIEENGLDAQAILGDLIPGDISADDFTRAMTAATNALAAQAEEQLRAGEQIAEQVQTPQGAAGERLRFLQQQISLLSALEEQGTAGEIATARRTLGLFASAENIERAAAAATNAAVRQAEIALLGALQLSSAMDQSAEEIFESIGEFESSAGVAGELLLERIVDPLKSTIANLVDGIAAAREESVKLGAEQRRISEEFSTQGGLSQIALQFASDRTQLTQRQIELFQRFIANQERSAVLQQQISQSESEIVATTAELVEQRERLARLAEQEQRLKFLEQQAQLLELIAEKGLDVEAVLGGLELGLDANVEDVIAAMTRAMELIVAQAEEELGIASPSKVFARIGGEAMEGMAQGIQRLMSLPEAQSAIATQAMIAAPAQIVSPRNTTIDNRRSMGDINISGRGGAGQMSDTQLVATIKREVMSMMRGEF